MFSWFKNLFKKKPVIIEIRETVEIGVKVPNRYNIRDKKGRFVKKGNKNGK